jgi:hypothetical protein
LLEADWQGTDMDLEHCAFLLDGFCDIDWLRAILKEDTKRLAPLMQAQATRVSNWEALTRCMQYDMKGYYAKQIATLLAYSPHSLLRATSKNIFRKQHLPTIPDAPAKPASTEQRLYELVTAISCVDTDEHVRTVAELLRDFGKELLDIAALTQDAQRVWAVINEKPRFDFAGQLPERKSLYVYRLTSGLIRLEVLINQYRGLVQNFARLLKELFASVGAVAFFADAAAYELLDSGRLPHTLRIKRVHSLKYTCLYVWLIEDNRCRPDSSEDQIAPLLERAQARDGQLVEDVLKPLVEGGRRGGLLKFVACVANDREHARAIAIRLAHEQELFSPGHLLAQLDAQEARHVALLGGNERPRAITVWGEESSYIPPVDWYFED